MYCNVMSIDILYYELWEDQYLHCQASRPPANWLDIIVFLQPIP